MVTSSYDGTAQVWDARTGKALLPSTLRQAGSSRVYTAKFSSDSKKIVTASLDGTAQVWDAQTGKQIGQTMRHDGAVYSANFNPAGTLVVTASADHTARIWDASTGTQLSYSGKLAALTHNGEVNLPGFRSGSQVDIHGFQQRYRQNLGWATFAAERPNNTA